MLPLKIGTTQQFEALREFLRASAFCEHFVANALGLGTDLDYVALNECIKPVENADPVLSFLIRVFVLGEDVERSELDSNIPGAIREAIRALELVCSEPTNPNSALLPGLALSGSRLINRFGSKEAT